VPLSALVLALAAAFAHALWNLLLARAADTPATTAVALVVATVAFAPVAAVFWDVETAAWPYIVASSCFELAYFALLVAAYERADLSVVYPLARGSAPVLVLLLAVTFGGAETSASQAGGVIVVALGVVLVRGIGEGAPSKGVGMALAIGGCIAAYTLIDKGGIRHANPIAYLELTMVAPSVAYAALVAYRKGSAALRRAFGSASVVAGIATFGAYALVLAALQRAPAAPVAAVRETSVVIAALLAAPLLGERVTRWRIAGSCLVVVGVVLLVR
jgi:drug/metabolite transporter (DMT)-like permease